MHYEYSKVYGAVPVSILKTIKDYFNITGPLRSATVMLDDSIIENGDNNQKQPKKDLKMKENTARPFDETFKQMSEQNQYAASNALMLGYNELENHYKFLRDEVYETCVTGSEEAKQVRLSMNDILAIMHQRLALTKNYLATESSPIDVDNLEDKKKKDPAKTPAKEVKVIQMKPNIETVDASKLAKETVDKQSETDKSVEADKTSESDTLLSFKDISINVKQYLLDGKEEQALLLANETFGKGKYIPKKDTQKPEVWDEKRIEHWLSHLKTAIKDVNKKAKVDNSDIKPAETETPPWDEQSKSPEKALAQHRAMIKLREKIANNPKEDATKEDSLTETEKADEALVFDYDYKIITEGFTNPKDTRRKILAFSMPKETLKEEEEAIAHLGKRMLEFDVKRTGNKSNPDDIISLFFKYRGYSKEQTDQWQKGVKNAGIEKLDKVNHFTLLGRPALFFGNKNVKDCTIKEDKLVETLNDTNKSMDDILDEFVPLLSGTLFKENSGVFSVLYTDLHAKEYILNMKKTLEKKSNKKEEVEEKKKEEDYKTHYDLKDFESLLQQAVNADSTLDDFIQANKDLLLKKDGNWKNLTTGDESITIKNEEDLRVWAKERYTVFEAERDAINEEKKKTETKKVESKEENRINILMSVLKEKILSFDKYEDFAKDSLTQDMYKHGVIVNAYDDEKDNGKEVLFYNSSRSSTKELKKWMKAFFNQVHEDAKKKTESESVEKQTLVDTFEDGEVRIHNFSQLKEEGTKLLKTKNRDEMITWIKRNVINRKLDDHKEESQIIKDETMAETLAEHMFGLQKESKITMTQEEADMALDTLLKDKDTNIITATRSYVDMTERMGSKLPLKKAFTHVKERAKEVAPEKFQTLEERVAEQKSRHIYVKDKFSIKFPEEWEKLKSISTLEELYNTCSAYKEKEDWQTALSFALEIVKLETIKETKGWDEKQVTDWFNNKLLADPIEESPSVEEKSEPISDGFDEAYEQISNAKNPKDFKQQIMDVLKKHEDKKTARVKIIDAIQNGKGKHTRKVSKMPVGDMHKMLNSFDKKIVSAES